MEYMPNFALHRPKAVEEAVKLRAAIPGALYVAGGTDMIVNVRRGIEQPAALIDLGAIEAMKAIRDEADALVIGAAVTLDSLSAHAAIVKGWSAIAEAAAAVAGPTHQKYATVGGNLCLDTRCLFYNQSEWWRKSNAYCLKERGELCHVAPGGKRCFAAFSGDVAPAMLVFGAEAELIGPDGARRMPLSELYRDDGMNHLALKPAELLVAVRLPKALAGAASAYEKARIRGSIDFPLAGVAVRLKATASKVDDLRIALTGVNPYPHIVAGLDAYNGKALDDAALDSIRETVRTQARPMKTTHVKPWYRRRVIGALARRTVARLAAV